MKLSPFSIQNHSCAFRISNVWYDEYQNQKKRLLNVKSIIFFFLFIVRLHLFRAAHHLNQHRVNKGTRYWLKLLLKLSQKKQQFTHSSCAKIFGYLEHVKMIIGKFTLFIRSNKYENSCWMHFDHNSFKIDARSGHKRNQWASSREENSKVKWRSNNGTH